MSVIARIREKLQVGDYMISGHAEEELAEDGFERADMRHALMNGFVERKYTEDPRGTRYRMEGPALDGRTMYVVCRFTETGPMIVITAFEKE